ncbi:MAG: nitronate monooxygenase [Deltaproteobacteria bacterium]|nr:nitronate monooxygenase [Deltaproteobacteria bacterium]
MLSPLRIKGKTSRLPIIQGGMGIGVSLHPLARAVAREGGCGVISSAALDRIVSKRTGTKHTIYSALEEEVSLAHTDGGFVGVNIMVALARDYRDSVKAAIDAGADAIISGGGLPLDLPAIHPPRDTALIPIVSSARSLEVICKKWERHRYRPDAAVLEGPLAGGHLGFKPDQIEAEEYQLERLLPPVKDVAKKYGDFPVIVAGGIFTHGDICRFLGLGADGVQLGTRFLATEESSASDSYKKAVVQATREDIIVAHRPGSPCGLPFRVIKHSPMFVTALQRGREPQCRLGYLLHKDAEGHYTICPARNSNENHFCICSGLLQSCGVDVDGGEELYTVGTNAYRVDRILPVKEVMAELAGR